MSTIDRYKKRGGFLQLLILLETTGGEKREKFMKLIGDENPNWQAEIKKKMLSLDRICSWPATYIMEIVPRLSIIQLASLASALPPEKAANFVGALGFKEKKGVEDLLKERAMTPVEINSSVMKIMAVVREMAGNGSLKFEKFDPDLAIPENIEEYLMNGGKPTVSDKELEAHFPTPTAATPGAPPAPASEELTQLRRKVVQLTQENFRLSQESQTLKDKLEQIRKIA